MDARTSDLRFFLLHFAEIKANSASEDASKCFCFGYRVEGSEMIGRYFLPEANNNPDHYYYVLYSLF